MDKSDGRRRAGRGGTNLASCAVAATFLILVAVALVVVFLVMFRPRGPKIQVDAVRLPGFAAGNGTVSFTFEQYAAVRNPNRDAFSHYDSTLQLIYAGNQVGFMFIPAGVIDGGRTQFMAASIAVSSSPLAAAAAGPGGGGMEVESRMRITGRLKVLRFLTHHVEATAGCRVGVSAGDGSVIGFRCGSDLPLL